MEHLTEHHEEKKETSRKWERKELLLAVLIGVLVLTAGLQTIQLMGLTRAEVVVSPGAGPAPATSSGSAPATPANLQNLPSMVGGC